MIIIKIQFSDVVDLALFFLVVVFFSLVFTKVKIRLRLCFELGGVAHVCNTALRKIGRKITCSGPCWGT